MNERERAAGLAATSSYRYADVVDHRMYVAGQVPVNADRVVVGVGDVRAQVRQCVTNLLAVLDVHGFSADDLHHVTVYVVGPHANLIDAWNEVVAQFSGDVPPATLLGVTALGYVDQLVEIDARVERATSSSA